MKQGPGDRPGLLQFETFGKAAPLGPLDHPQDENEDDGADRRCNDGREEPAADTDVKNAREPAADEGADDAHDDIAGESESAALDKRARKPARDGTDKQPDDNAMRIHDGVPRSVY